MTDAEPADVAAFLAASAAGDLAALRAMLDRDPGLARVNEGTTGLHQAAAHPDAVRLLLEHGADPNARESGDHALPLHFAAGGGPLASVRALLDGGSDVHGHGDAHRLDVIGWATVFAEPRRDVVELLLERGARHHVFSAIALGDREALRRLATDDPGALSRRLSEHEQEQTALHYVVAHADGLLGGTFRTGEHHATLALLLELGADPAAVDARGRTPLEVAALRGDDAAMRLLHDAGARLPAPDAAAPAEIPPLRATSVHGVSTMLGVRDVAATLAWYGALGFELTGSHSEAGALDFASVRLGDAELMFVPAGQPGRPVAAGVTLWFRTDRVDDLHAALRRHQLERARALLAGDAPSTPPVPFVVDLHAAFYGQREFGIRDPDGMELMFAQPLEPDTPEPHPR